MTTEMTISGNGAANTIVQASTCNPVTLPGSCTPATYRVFNVTSAGNLTLDGLTVQYGATSGDGGGVYNNGRLTVTDSTVSSNSASGNGGGIFDASSYTLTITDSTLSGNSAAGDGGGINNADGSLTVINSTLYGNSASGIGGGINYSGEETETLRVINSTLSGNSANFGGGINRNNPDGINQFILNNSIIANNNGGNCGDVGGPGFESYNTLFGDDCADVSGGSDGNLVGDPQLSALADNGGATQTMALQTGSPAINVGDNSLAVDAKGNPLSYDQRGAGYDRIVAGTVDMGAYEYELDYTPDFVVDRTDDTNVAICSTAANDCSLRGAINLANRLDGTDTITFDSSAFNPNTITLSGSDLPAISDSLIINGTGASLVTVNGANSFRPFTINSDVNVSLQGSPSPTAPTWTSAAPLSTAVRYR